MYPADYGHLDEPPNKDRAFKKYESSIDRALALFPAAAGQEWADYISFLGRLLKVCTKNGLVMRLRVLKLSLLAGSTRAPPDYSCCPSESNGCKAAFPMLTTHASLWRTPQSDRSILLHIFNDRHVNLPPTGPVKDIMRLDSFVC